MNEHFGFIYLTYCKISGKIYIGQKYSRRGVDTYLGSGKLFKKALEKYGKDNFERHIIEFCDSREVLNLKERYWIKKYNSTDRDIGYNLAEGGTWGRCEITDKTRHKLSMALRGRKVSDTTRLKISRSSKGKKMSLESRLKMSKSAKGRKGSNANRICIQKNTLRKYIDISDINKYLSEGWVIGNKKSNIHQLNQSNSRKNLYKIILDDFNIVVRGKSNIHKFLLDNFNCDISETEIKILIKTGNSFLANKNKHKKIKGLRIEKIDKRGDDAWYEHR